MEKFCILWYYELSIILIKNTTMVTAKVRTKNKSILWYYELSIVLIKNTTMVTAKVRITKNKRKEKDGTTDIDSLLLYRIIS